ncbi:MAG: tetratricopeptide repeat protein, partial [Candidatus Sumerlaeia bacterium]|nr:tetratricopeptide repeat protein [Candidatus Sumerlaeia bacterium]
GYCYSQLNNKQGLIALIHQLKREISIPPEEFYLPAASLLVSYEEQTEAVSLLKEFLSTYKTNPMLYNAYNQLAEIYISQKDYNSAEMIYKNCQQIFSNDRLKVIDAIYNQGEMERRKGNYAEAIKIWRNLAEKYPRDVGAQNALISAAIVAENNLADKTTAVNLYRRFLQLSPQDINNIKLATQKLKTLSGEKDSKG